MENKEVIRNLFTNLFENKNFDLKDISKFAQPDYVQHVNGKTLDYAEFVKHITVLKSKIDTCSVTFKTLVSEGDTVFSNHVVDIVLTDGHKAKTQVIAEFRLRDNKLYYCDELTHLLDGAEEHKNLGSVSE